MSIECRSVAKHYPSHMTWDSAIVFLHRVIAREACHHGIRMRLGWPEDAVTGNNPDWLDREWDLCRCALAVQSCVFSEHRTVREAPIFTQLSS